MSAEIIILPTVRIVRVDRPWLWACSRCGRVFTDAPSDGVDPYPHADLLPTDDTQSCGGSVEAIA